MDQHFFDLGIERMNHRPLTSSDKELFEALRQGDRKAFAVLYEQYWYRLFLGAYHRLKQKEPAEELVQDLFVNLWKKKDTIQVTHVENYGSSDHLAIR